MKELIDELFEIIKDHMEEISFTSKERIENWITQFDTADREFVMKETIHILKQRYISKKNGKEHVRGMIEYLMEQNGCETVKEFIAQSYFINNQAEGKSQGQLLSFLDEILQKEYDTSLSECNDATAKYIVYLDDILCTGQTIIDGLTHKEHGWFNLNHSSGVSNYDYFKDNNAKLLLGYLSVHKRCSNKLNGRLWFALGKRPISYTTIWREDFVIDNDISIKDSSLNFLWPTADSLTEDNTEGKAQIEQKVIDNEYAKVTEIPLRDKSTPAKESLFTSKENRIRYETIILSKSLDIYNKAPGLNAKARSRPLGYGLYHEMTFGFGTLIFSWRNVPFNTPLVFWYPHNDWTPLFHRNYT